MRLLICDDHAVLAEALALLLEEAGNTVVAVTDSPDRALAVLRTEPVDMCLLHIDHPSGSFLDVLLNVRAAAPDAKLVLLTAVIQPGVVAAGTAAGVDGFVDKRQRIEDLVTLIARVHAGEVIYQPSGDGHASRRHIERSDVQRLARYLTPREREVLSHLVRGESAIVCARSMGVSATTTRTHIQSVLTKLGVHSQLEAVTAAVRNDLVSVETGEWLAR
ncbi:two-component system nitrate/nitrite response regulator NarL [Kribbella antiqua]|uniref:Two-component system nitrate/nitrite response regulator NarL n=1 Tax=Kribbella antiqua TaxID=2512217 RepID=A0A4R2ICM9_9ACTN|nr:response regulator transcription factor [Kribbella antiqua]TCO42314.1 two-component system nitrate/nitrite response regulator NarL [Kribbella antiqua]